MSHRVFFIVLSVLLLVVGCASAPPPAPAAGPSLPDDATVFAEVRAAGAHGVELVVAPLVDPQVEDLRASARHAEQRGRWQRAERLLDKALAISVDDPDLLQWRAEVALMRGDRAAAEQFARRSARLGPRLGPLCRRNWTLLWRLAEARGELANTLSAQAMQQGCTVAPPVRM